jgi:oxygen-independent coproporphyrinogen-3 oxidase
VVAAPEAPGLYLHVPFCASICPYCDFAVARGDAPARERFTRALVTEIERSAAGVAAFERGAPFDTVYFGGGTPSHLEPAQLGAILQAARSSLAIAADALVILEANPEDVDAAAVAAWRELGVGGLSLGVQSFDSATLRFLGRRHSGEEASRAAELALGAGFDWVSLDLIYGTPGSSDALDRALADVATAVALGTPHLSAYQLTVHEGTPFGAARDRGRLRELPSDDQASLLFAVHDALAAGGLAGYEVSNFARDTGHRSRHNTKYWRHTPYLGVGPSAHSFDGARRWWNRRDWREWADAIESGASPRAGEETLTRGQLALEALLLALRTSDGLDLDLHRERHGVDLVARNQRRIADSVAAGLLVWEHPRLAPTTRGMAVADALAASFDLEDPGLE